MHEWAKNIVASNSKWTNYAEKQQQKKRKRKKKESYIHSLVVIQVSNSRFSLDVYVSDSSWGTRPFIMLFSTLSSVSHNSESTGTFPSTTSWPSCVSQGFNIDRTDWSVVMAGLEQLDTYQRQTRATTPLGTLRHLAYFSQSGVSSCWCTYQQRVKTTAPPGTLRHQACTYYSQSGVSSCWCTYQQRNKTTTPPGTLRHQACKYYSQSGASSCWYLPIEW